MPAFALHNLHSLLLSCLSALVLLARADHPAAAEAPESGTSDEDPVALGKSQPLPTLTYCTAAICAASPTLPNWLVCFDRNGESVPSSD